MQTVGRGGSGRCRKRKLLSLLSVYTVSVCAWTWGWLIRFHGSEAWGSLTQLCPYQQIHICSGLHPFSAVTQKVVQVAPFLISKLSPVAHQRPPPSGPGREEEELHSTNVFVLHSDSIYKLLRVSAETAVDCGLFCFLNI